MSLSAKLVTLLLKRGYMPKFNSRIAGALVLAAASVSSAQAALPTEVTAAFSAISTDATDLLATGWPVLIVVFGGMILMKLFKKVASKAT